MTLCDLNHLLKDPVSDTGPGLRTITRGCGGPVHNPAHPRVSVAGAEWGKFRSISVGAVSCQPCPSSGTDLCRRPPLRQPTLTLPPLIPTTGSPTVPTVSSWARPAPLPLPLGLGLLQGMPALRPRRACRVDGALREAGGCRQEAKGLLVRLGGAGTPGSGRDLWDLGAGRGLLNRLVPLAPAGPGPVSLSGR